MPFPPHSQKRSPTTSHKDTHCSSCGKSFGFLVLQLQTCMLLHHPFLLPSWIPRCLASSVTSFFQSSPWWRTSSNIRTLSWLLLIMTQYFPSWKEKNQWISQFPSLFVLLLSSFLLFKASFVRFLARVTSLPPRTVTVFALPLKTALSDRLVASVWLRPRASLQDSSCYTGLSWNPLLLCLWNLALLGFLFCLQLSFPIFFLGSFFCLFFISKGLPTSLHS